MLKIEIRAKYYIFRYIQLDSTELRLEIPMNRSRNMDQRLDIQKYNKHRLNMRITYDSAIEMQPDMKNSWYFQTLPNTLLDVRLRKRKLI